MQRLLILAGIFVQLVALANSAGIPRLDQVLFQPGSQVSLDPGVSALAGHVVQLIRVLCDIIQLFCRILTKGQIIIISFVPKVLTAVQ